MQPGRDGPHNNLSSFRGGRNRMLACGIGGHDTVRFPPIAIKCSRVASGYELNYASKRARTRDRLLKFRGELFESNTE